MEEKVCEERHHNINKRVDNVEDRMTKLEDKVTGLDKSLGERINTLEITMKLSTESTNNKIDKLDRKLDKVLEDKEGIKIEGESNKDDRLDKFINVMLEMVQTNNKTNNDMKFYKTKQFWALVISIATTIGAVLLAIFE